MGELLKETLGLQLLHWAFARSPNVSWGAAGRCAVDFVHGIHEPLERSAAVLDGILTGEREEENDDDDDDSMSGRNDGDDGFDQRWNGADDSGDYEARRDIWLNGLDVHVQRHNFGYVDDDGDDGECGAFVLFGKCHLSTHIGNGKCG